MDVDQACELPPSRDYNHFTFPEALAWLMGACRRDDIEMASGLLRAGNPVHGDHGESPCLWTRQVEEGSFRRARRRAWQGLFAGCGRAKDVTWFPVARPKWPPPHFV